MSSGLGGSCYVFCAVSGVVYGASDRFKVFLRSVVLGRSEVVLVVYIASQCSMLFFLVLRRLNGSSMFCSVLGRLRSLGCILVVRVVKSDSDSISCLD